MSQTPTNRRRPALIAALVALATTLVFALPGAVRPAEATPSTAPRATPATSLKLLLSTVTPAIATADSEVTLTGQVINTGAETVPAPDVRLTGSFTPLAGRDAIAAWATGRPSAIETSLIDHFSTTGDLRPGGRANFILTVPAPGPEGAAFGALPMAISVAGTQLRTFVPMQRRMEYEPLRLAVLVPLTLDPDPALLGTYAAPRLAAWRTQLADTSRFQRLLDATEDLPVTWAIDPTLLNPPSAIPDVRPTEAEAGAAWDRITSAQREEARLRRTADTALRARLAGHSPLLLPYADADLAGLLNLPGQSGLIAPALAATRTIAKGLPGARTDILWPADNRVGTDRVRALLTAAGQPGIRAVLGPESALPDKNTDQAPHPGPNGSAVLTYDDRLGNLLLTLPADGSRAGSPGGASGDGTGALTAQRMLADTLGLLGEFPGTPRRILLAAPRTLDASSASLRPTLTALLTAPWIQPGTLDELIDAAGTGSGIPEQAPEASAPADVPRDPSLARDGLTPARVEVIQRGMDALAGLAEVRTDGTDNWAYWSQVHEQMLSSRWRADRAALRPAIEAIKAAGNQARDGVSVVPGRINFFADSGQLQVTVKNDLDVAVENVTVRLDSLVPSFRLTGSPAPVTIGPHSRTTVRVPATALAAATVPIRVSLYTPTGQHFGNDDTVQVRAYPTGSWFYWVIGAVAILLLLAGRWRTRRRRRTSTEGSISA